MSLEELKDRIGGNSRDLVVLDIREKDAFANRDAVVNALRKVATFIWERA